MGSFAMTDQTRMIQIRARMTRNLILSQNASFLRVSKSSSLGRPPGGGSPSAARAFFITGSR